MAKVFNPSYDALEVTKAAAKHFQRQLEKKYSLGIYIGIKLKGCSGFAYDICFVNKKPTETTLVKKFDINFFISNKSIDFLHGLKIDYVQHECGLYKLKYLNTNELARCGCGDSFAM